MPMPMRVLHLAKGSEVVRLHLLSQLLNMDMDEGVEVEVEHLHRCLCASE